jgi:hypothetical protein
MELVMRDRRNILLSAAAILAAASTSIAFTGAASAQNWPQKPVTVIVPFAAGGNTDGIGRIAAQRLSEAFGQQFVVEGSTRRLHTVHCGFAGHGNCARDQQGTL